jgi:hypothetical protein
MLVNEGVEDTVLTKIGISFGNWRTSIPGFLQFQRFFPKRDHFPRCVQMKNRSPKDGRAMHLTCVIYGFDTFYVGLCSEKIFSII